MSADRMPDPEYDGQGFLQAPSEQIDGYACGTASVTVSQNARPRWAG